MIKEESTVEDQREQDTTPYFSLQVDNGKTNMKENVLTLFMSTYENEVINNGVLDQENLQLRSAWSAGGSSSV